MTPAANSVSLSAGSLLYRDVGSGPPVVFVHGLMVDGRIWDPVLPLLAKSMRCIVPDWPQGAHKRPMQADADLSVPGLADLIADFIEALDLHDVTLVGNDTGGALSQLVCARRPQRIARLVLTTCDAYEVFPPPTFAILKALGRVPGLVWLTSQALHLLPVLRRLPFTYGDLTDAPLDGALVAQWIAPLRQQPGVRRDLRKILRSLSAHHTLAAATELRSFQRPALLLWSTRCHHFPEHLAQRLHRDLPRAELQWLDSAGVFLSLDHGSAVARRIAAFVAADRDAAYAPKCSNLSGHGSKSGQGRDRHVPDR